MQIVQNNALRFAVPTKQADIIRQYIERSEELERNTTHSQMLMYWDYDEAMRLSTILDRERPNDELPDIPSPILRDYDWPGIYRPMIHQRTTAAFLSLRRRAFCFNEAGTGKTSAAIWAADYLIRLGKVKRVLVVCPLSIMYSAWQADIFKTAMHRTAAVAYGPREKRAKIINGNYDFVIINYDGLNVVRDEVAAGNFDLIIIDEANAYKDSATKRWKTLTKLMTLDTWLWMMTGTPASQSPEDAFGLARLVSPERVPKFKTAWRDKVMYQVTRFKWQPRANSTNMVFNALQPAIRFIKKECLDLPELVYQTRVVPLSGQALVYYRRLKQQMLIEAAGQQITAANAAASLNKLLQISGGAVYTDDRNIVEFDITPRLSAFQEVLDEAAHKVIVFVPYLHTIPIVQEYLTKHGITNEAIYGDVSATNRAEIINRFQQAPDPHVLVIQPQAASHGVTLTAADTVVFWSPVMSVETYLQCIARIDRVGQKNSMTVVRLQGSEAERRIYDMLEGRVDSHQKLVDLYKAELGI